MILEQKKEIEKIIKEQKERKQKVKNFLKSSKRTQELYFKLFDYEIHAMDISFDIWEDDENG